MTSLSAADASVPLADGRPIPLLGLGTWQLEGDTAYESVRAALDVGYRHLDTATAYFNEEEVGAAVRDSRIARDEIFVTTKCPAEYLGKEQDTLHESLRRLNLDHVDLWLVHWPPNREAHPEMWQQFIAARDAGKTVAIGVSNYSIAQIDELIEATGEAPAVNQIPWSPALYDAELVAAHEQRKVVLEGYSPLRRTRLDDPTLAEIAEAHGKSPAQVVLRWHLERGIVVIPKSARRERIEENFAIFDFALSTDEVGRLDALGT